MDSFVIGFSLISAAVVVMVVFMNRESKKYDEEFPEHQKTEEEKFQEHVDKFL